jgi:serine/threonine-protein kinase
VHRDVKPGNILVTSDGRVMLTDFGIAKGIQPDDDLTSDNVMMGTAKYLSPEQVRGKRLDGRADLYSLALVLYECLAGRVPFIGETDADTALARLQRDPTDLGHLRPTLPIGLVNLIHRTLARNPAHRPQTGSELRSSLLSVDTSPPAIDGTPAELPEHLANPPRVARGAGPGNPGNPGVVGRPASVGVPGDPHLTSRVPVQSARVYDDAAVHDVTPRVGEPIRGRPARGNQQRIAPSLVVVAALLVVALTVAAILFLGVNRGDESDDFTRDTAVPGADATAAVSTPPAPSSATTPAAANLRIAVIQAWDPAGDNGTENDTQAALAVADGSDSTSWPTECYANEYLSGKPGVGLILTLSAASAGTLHVESLNGPYQVDVFTAPGTTPPAELAGWTQVGDTHFADQPGSFDATIEQPTQMVLVWLKQLGRDEFCTERNPYRGRLGEISFTP